MVHDIEVLKSRILARGVDDWVYAAEVVEVTQVLFGEQLFADYPNDDSMSMDQLASRRRDWLVMKERQALPFAIDAVKALVREGLARIGDVTNGVFVPWTGSLIEIESRIDSILAAAELPLLPGAFWLENTPLGDKRVERMLTED